MIGPEPALGTGQGLAGQGLGLQVLGLLCEDERQGTRGPVTGWQKGTLGLSQDAPEQLLGFLLLPLQRQRCGKIGGKGRRDRASERPEILALLGGGQRAARERFRLRIFPLVVKGTGEVIDRHDGRDFDNRRAFRLLRNA